MDPISIAVSAISVAGAAAKISIWLYDVVETTRNVDTAVQALHREVKALDDNLKSLSQTLRGCQSQALTLMHMNDDIWHSIENNLHDCGEALEELQKLVEEVKRPIASRNIFRKPNLAVRLAARKREISEFQDKINKSNSAMQTAVGVVSLSLALRQNVSSDMLMSELQRLRGLVEKTQAAARDSSHVSYPAAARMSRSLQGLAQAARKFHSHASSTASTRYEGARQSHARRHGSAWLGSDSGSLTDLDRDRIQDWTSGLRPIDEGTDTASTVGTTPTRTITTATDRETVVTTPDLEDEDDDDLELDLEIFQNAEELGRLCFARRDYDRAEKFLNKAMSGVAGTSTDPARFENLKLQLSICYCLQAKWPLAEAVLTTLGKKKRKADLPVFHLFHAVALGHMADKQYDSAYKACKRSLQGKKKAYGGKTNQEYIDSLCLLAAICDRRGEPIEAAAIMHSIPGGKIQTNFPKPQEYIRSHKSIIDDAFGAGFEGSEEAGPSSGGAAAAEDDDDAWSFQASDQGDAADRVDQDTGKEIATDNEGRISSQVGGWDTGKEILSVPYGSHMTINPVTNKRIISDVETYDQETGRILAWAEWENGEWVPLQRYFDAHHYMIDDLIIDEEARRNHALPSMRMLDEDKHSDLLVVDIERSHDAAYGSDSLKELFIPHEHVPDPLVRPMGPGPGIQYSYSTWQPPALGGPSFTNAFSANLYISEPRFDGVTSAPPLHTYNNSMDNSLLSPTTSAQAYRNHQGTRSADFTSSNPFEQPYPSNNPFRRAVSQRNPATPETTLKHAASSATLRESPTHSPPAPWTGRRYGSSARDFPWLLGTPLVFLRDVPDGPTDGLILAVHLSLETAQVAVSFDTGAVELCPGTMYLNHTFNAPDTTPWFDHLHPSPSKENPISLATHPYHLLQIIQMHVGHSPFLSATSTTIPLPNPATYQTATSLLSSSLSRLASGIETWIDRTRGGFYLAFTPLDEIVVSVPDCLLAIPGAREELQAVLHSTPLFRHAKVTPASLSVVWFFLRNHGREVLVGPVTKNFNYPAGALGPGRSQASVRVLVVQVGELVTEVGVYNIVSESGAVVVRLVGEVRGEVDGAVAVEVEFARLAYGKAMALLNSRGMDVPEQGVRGLVRSCVVGFRREVLMDFHGVPEDSWGFWTPALMRVPEFPDLTLEFSYGEIRACFEVVTGRIGAMVAEAVGGGGGEEGRVSNIFLAGSFARSPLVAHAVREAVRLKGAPKVWVRHDCASLGAVVQGKQTDFVHLQMA